MEIMAEFLLIASDFPMEVVYKKIGLKGEIEFQNKKTFNTLSGGSYLRPKSCSITYTTGYINTINVEETIGLIYDLLHPREKQIIDSINQFNLQSKFCIVLNLTDNPCIYLPQKFINMASRLHADIEFDTYIG